MSEKIEVSREQWMTSVNSYIDFIHNGKTDTFKCGFCEVLDKADIFINRKYPTNCRKCCLASDICVGKADEASLFDLFCDAPDFSKEETEFALQICEWLHEFGQERGWKY